MKKVLIAAYVLIGMTAFASRSHAASLSHVYDFSAQGWDSVDGVTFEGLTFTKDGTLWITSAPNSTPNQGQLIAATLDFAAGTVQEIISQEAYTNSVRGDVFGFASSLFNPVALASDGEELFVGSNAKSGLSFFNNYVYSTDQSAVLTDPYKISASICNDPEGAAYLDGAIYLSCEESHKIIKLHDDGSVEDLMTGVTALGLAASDTSLIVGDYANHDLFLYDLETHQETARIDLETLFPDYEIEVGANDIRNVPDPDGLAFYNGKIYMTFEHDLRVFEISLGEDSSIATPEPGTLILLGPGLLGLFAAWRKCGRGQRR